MTCEPMKTMSTKRKLRNILFFCVLAIVFFLSLNPKIILRSDDKHAPAGNRSWLTVLISLCTACKMFALKTPWPESWFSYLITVIWKPRLILLTKFKCVQWKLTKRVSSLQYRSRIAPRPIEQQQHYRLSVIHPKARFHSVTDVMEPRMITADL